MRVEFGGFTFDLAGRQLLGRDGPVHLSPKAFDVLRLLIERRPAAVSKDDLLAQVWPGTFVVEASLTMAIAEVRRALGDESRAPRFIRTVHRYGYAFCGEGRDVGASPPGEDSTRPAWLVWNGQRLTLRPGENLIGRDPRSHVWLDVAGVSRRHARIFVTGGEALLEDLGSKNGTSVGTRAVTGALPLADGDVIECGPVALQFRRWSESSAAETERVNRRG